MIRETSRLFLPASPEAAVWRLGGNTSGDAWGRRFVDDTHRGELAAVLVLPPAPARVDWDRIGRCLARGGSVVWVGRRGPAPPPPPPLEVALHLELGRTWALDPEARWITPIPPTAKVDLVDERLRRGLRSAGARRADPRFVALTVYRRAGEPDHGWLGSLLARLDDGNVRGIGAARLGQLRATSNGLLVAQLGSDDGTWALKVAFDAGPVGARLHQQADRLSRLRGRMAPFDSLDRVMPSVLASAEWADVPYVVERWLPGHPLLHTMYDPRSRPKAVDRALAWITELHAASREPGHSVEELRTWTDGALADVEAATGIDTTPWRARIADYVASRLGEGQIPAVAMHGDYWLANVLGDRRTHDVTAVLDWDVAMPRGFPLCDPLNLLASRKGWWSRLDRERFLLRLWRRRTGTRDRTRLARYVRALELRAAAIGALSLVYWMHYTRAFAPTRADRRDEWRRAVGRVLDRLGASFEADLDRLGPWLLAD